MYKQKGMTLVELVITLAIVALLISAAVPSVREMLISNRMTAVNNQLVSAFNYTRGEAVKRAYDVTMCARNSTGQDCSSFGTFTTGWIIFVDCNNDGVVTTTNVCDYNGDGTPEAAEQVLADTTADMSGITIASNSTSPAKVNYKANGNVSAAGSWVLKYNSQARYLITLAAITGRVSSCKVNTTTCIAPI